MFGEGDSLEKGGDRLDANPIRLERLTLGCETVLIWRG